MNTSTFPKNTLRFSGWIMAVACVILFAYEAVGMADPKPVSEKTDSLVERQNVPTHLLAKGMAEAQVLLDKSNGLNSAALSMVSGKSGWAVPEHRHPEADEILYVLEGGGKLTLNGQQIKIQADTAVFIPKNAPHSFIAGDQGIRALQVYAPGGPEQRFLKAPTK